MADKPSNGEGRFVTKDGAGRFVDPHRAIFPIMKRHPDKTELIGTGFFISEYGHFATAKHVFFKNDGVTPEEGLHALHFVEGDAESEKLLVREINRISFSETSDVALGAMDFHIENDSGELLRNYRPTFNFSPPPIGTGIVTYAYPNSSRFFDDSKTSKIVADFHSGELISYSDTARDSVMITWPHYEMSIEGGGRTSGGPVFDESGKVIGVYSADGAGRSYACPVSDLLPLRVPYWPGSTEDDEPYLAQLIENSYIASVQTVVTKGDNYEVIAS